MISQASKITGAKQSVRSKKSVRFTSEINQRILELPTWRRPVDAETRQTDYELSDKARNGMAVIRFALAKMLYVRLPIARRASLEVSTHVIFSATY
jgi:hypothetical protein